MYLVATFTDDNLAQFKPRHTRNLIGPYTSLSMQSCLFEQGSQCTPTDSAKYL